MPPRRTTSTGYAHSRRLRKELTPAEQKLWAYLRNGRLQGVEFGRQHAIGPYIVDFRAPRHHLIIELDGSPHLNRREEDLQRTEHLTLGGYRVLRFWNHEVLNQVVAVAASILEALQLT